MRHLMPTLRELTTDEEWDRAVQILRQLWSHREEADVRSWHEETDYRPFGWYVDDADEEAETLVAVAGVYVQTVLHHERSLWVHDFVVDEAHRGEGHGAVLLEALERWGDERDCGHVALACVADNDEAARFYEHVGMEAFGTIYETEL